MNGEVFRAEETATIPFEVERLTTPPCYVVNLQDGIAAARLEKVVAIARQATLEFGGIDDLDTLPDVNQFPVDIRHFQLTHCLEHLVVLNLVRTNPLARLQWWLSPGKVGHTTIYRSKTNPEYRLVGFSLAPGFSPSPEAELTSLQGICSAVSQIPF